MDINSNDDVTVEVDTWLDDIGDFLSGIGDRIHDFLTPDLTVEFDGQPVDDAGAWPADSATGGDLPNDGFYQSLPGVDSMTGQVLDQTYQLIDDINDVGVDAIGQDAWDQTLIAAQTDPFGLQDGIETPAELEQRFAHEDAAAAERFSQWQTEQDGQYALDHGADVIHDSEWLRWDTNQLLNRDW